MVLGILSLLGLLSALIADGIWDDLSSAALATPVGAIIWFVMARKK